MKAITAAAMLAIGGIAFLAMAVVLRAEQATADSPPPPTTIIGGPIEVILANNGNTADVYPVFSQCDGHGHRIFASRHPERFVVLTDATCPGGSAEAVGR